MSAIGCQAIQPFRDDGPADDIEQIGAVHFVHTPRRLFSCAAATKPHEIAKRTSGVSRTISPRSSRNPAPPPDQFLSV